MADIIDKANDLVEMTEKFALESLRSQKPKALFTGFCLHCEIVVEEPKRWCDADCRDQWEVRNK
jgi:hypothetical protein